MPVARRAARPNVGQDVGPASIALAQHQRLLSEAPHVWCLSEASNRQARKDVRAAMLFDDQCIL